MNLPVDERLLSVQGNLEKERMIVIEQKKQLFERFRTFALRKLKTNGQPFEIKFSSINGNPNLKYKDLNMGDKFLLKYGKFTFDPKTNLLINYIRIEISETKTTEDFEELTRTSKSRPRPFAKMQMPLDNATEFERSKIDRKIQIKVNKILEGIFSGKLNFNDPDFKMLVNENIALERRLQELNARIAALSIVNGGLGLNITKKEQTNPELSPKDNRAAIIDFLKEDAKTM